MRTRLYPVFSGALFLIALLFSCTSPARHLDHHNHHGHEHHGDFGRLVVHTDDGTVMVLDAADGDVLARFTGKLDAGAAMVHANSTGEFAYVTHRSNWTTLVVDSGFTLEDHGDHYDLHEHTPEIQAELRTGAKPSHFYSAGGRTIVYNDDSGTISVIDESTLRSSPVVTSFKARVDHGAPVLFGDSVIVGYLNSPDIDVFSMEGTVRQRFTGGSRLHGEARFGRFTAFGLEEGIALVTWNGREFSTGVAPNPSGLTGGARVNHLRSHVLVPHFIGRTNTGNFLVSFDPVSKEWKTLQLSAPFAQFGFDMTGEHLVVLDSEGTLHDIDPDTLRLRGSLRSATGTVAPLADGMPAATLSYGKGHVWVSDPASSVIRLVSLDHLEIEAEFPVEGPGRITAIVHLQTAGVKH